MSALCRNCGHDAPHTGQAGDVDDACTHPLCDCGFFAPSGIRTQAVLDAVAVRVVQTAEWQRGYKVGWRNGRRVGWLDATLTAMAITVVVLMVWTR